MNYKFIQAKATGNIKQEGNTVLGGVFLKLLRLIFSRANGLLITYRINITLQCFYPACKKQEYGSL